MAQKSVSAFFSYSREDSEFALDLARDLKAAGAFVWIDRLDIKPGQHWDREVEKALRDWEAGIHMIPEIRSRFPNAPPIIIYAHRKAVEAHEEKARNLGASLVTGSRERLVSWLDNLLSQRD